MTLGWCGFGCGRALVLGGGLALAGVQLLSDCPWDLVWVRLGFGLECGFGLGFGWSLVWFVRQFGFGVLHLFCLHIEFGLRFGLGKS